MSRAQHEPGVARRTVLQTASGTAVALVVLTALPHDAAAQAGGNKFQDVLKKLVNGKEAKPGKVKLRIPEIAENGNTVPLTVAVDSPMTAQDYVKAVHVVTDGNPAPDVMSVQFTPECGKAEVSARIRLARTQNVIAYAEMSDGSVWSAIAEAKVTIGGCGG
jgi:sulfur-oxidizing protein SoxY